MRTWSCPGGLVVAFTLLVGCDEPPPNNTGGTDITPGPYGRGLVVIDTDYSSSNVALISFDGEMLSPSFISSGHGRLSSDVAVPTMPIAGDDVVLLDRASSVMTWVDVRTGEIREQYHSDRDELGRNPWDYLPISPEKAYVTRYDRWPGNSVHGDMIVVNPKTVSLGAPVDKRIAIAKSINLPGKEYWIHPARGVVVGDKAYVTTVIATPDYDYSTSYLVVIDTTTDEVLEAKELSDLRDCTGIAVSPDSTELAITCSGDLHAGEKVTQAGSALLVLAVGDLSEKKRIAASKIAAGPLGYSLSYATDRSIVVTAFGDDAVEKGDVVKLVDLDTEEVRDLHHAGPVQIGAVLCPARVDGATEGLEPEACFLTDADSFSVLRFPVGGGGVLGDPRTISVDEGRGRPPRYLGQF